MSNETKRDVFNQVAGELNDLMGTIDSGGYYHRYETALPDDLPVIPQIIADYIKQEHADNYDLGHAFWMAYESSEEIGHVATWIIKHSNEFATAWLLDDWEVEE